MIGIYKITNMITGKIYVGQSIDIQKRWGQHKRAWKSLSKKSQLYEAIREDGIENFKFEVIEECDKELLNEREEFWINKLNSLENGYNMSKIQNLQRKISPLLAKEIIEEIQNSDLNSKQLAEKYSISRTWISLVNQGKLWHNKDLKYPLRNFQNFDESDPSYCIDCGKSISKTATRCERCLGLKIEKDFQERYSMSREKLKRLIREKSFSEIGREYGVSDNAVRKWCDKFNLPRRSREIKSYSNEEWSKI